MTVEEALSGEHAAIWQEAMRREMAGHFTAGTFAPDKGTWTPGDNITSGKWIFLWKHDEFGVVTRAKARLCARGFSQVHGVDYFEKFSPCPSVSCVRLLAAIACELGFDICHSDCDQAFVQSRLKERVYMRLPRGCGSLSGKVVVLERSLYGLKQASRTWHIHLIAALKSLGFEQCAADACVLRLVENGSVTLVIAIHVDDLFTCGRKSRCDKFVADLNRLLPVNNLGILCFFGGCRFTQDLVAGSVKMSQETFAQNLVRKFGVTRNKPTPMSVDTRLDVFDPCEPDVEEEFRSLVGHLMWLANQTRPDIYFAVRAVARYSHAPKMVHWRAALHILMYVRFTLDVGITYQRGTGTGVSLQVFVDSDFASKATDRRSVSGLVVKCAGACVSFSSKTQRSVALSSSEAEYVAMAEGLKEAIFLRYVWAFVFPGRDVGCTVVYEDNMGALHLAKNPATTPNSKHIDIRHHFIRERIGRGEFRVVHVASKYQQADFLTKALPREDFYRHRNAVMNIA